MSDSESAPRESVPTTPTTVTAPRRLRWWPALLIVVAAAIALPAGIFAPAYRDVAQYQMLWAQSVVGATLILLCLWFVLVSGLPGKLRAGAAVAVGLLVLSAVLLFRIEGVTGDLRPIIAPRFRLGSATAEPAHNQAIELTPTEHDFPQFLGPDRDAIVRQVRLDADWQSKPPQVLWQRAMGDAWSSFAVVGDYAFTQEQYDAEEQIACYALATGEPVWRYRYPAEFRTVIAGVGPRATPTVADGRLYAMGATGIMHCLDAREGSPVWTRDTLSDAKAENRLWGVSCSPLLLDEYVIVSCGGANGWSLVAYDKSTGDVAWHAGDSPAGYSSPIWVTLAGVPQILIVNERNVTAHDPSDGRILWEHPWGAENPVCANPIVIGENQVFLSAGYGYGCVLLDVAPSDDGVFAVREVWPRNRNMKLKFNNGVHLDGYIYGLDDGVLACLDLKTGKRRWKAGRYGHGQLLLVGDLLLIQAETGELVLVRATPEKHDELATAAALNDKTWNNPALSGPLLLVRNAKEAACLRLPILD